MRMTALMTCMSAAFSCHIFCTLLRPRLKVGITYDPSTRPQTEFLERHLGASCRIFAELEAEDASGGSSGGQISDIATSLRRNAKNNSKCIFYTRFV